MIKAMVRVLQFTLKGATSTSPIEVSIGVPEVDGDNNWMSLLEITGFEEAYSKRIPGADGIQAVLSAAGIEPHLLAALAAGGRVTLDGRDDLGFSLPGAP